MVGQYLNKTNFDLLAAHIQLWKLTLTALNPLAMLSSFSDPAQRLEEIFQQWVFKQRRFAKAW
jgi:hypothetical protein